MKNHHFCWQFPIFPTKNLGIFQGWKEVVGTEAQHLGSSHGDSQISGDFMWEIFVNSPIESTKKSQFEWGFND
jgi:hypothetical protein